MKKIISLICILFSLNVLAGYYGRGGRGGERRPEHGYERRPVHGHRVGHIEHPIRFRLPPAPYRGWRGEYYNNHYVWAWGPWAPWWSWRYYEGWRLGLFYYVPEGIRCYADNSQVPGEWMGQEVYYSSEDAINSALGYCENDPLVYNQNASNVCRIRNCVRW